MILAALHALILWLAVLLSTHADAHPVPDTPPAVAIGDQSPTTRHLAPPAPTAAPPPADGAIEAAPRDGSPTSWDDRGRALPPGWVPATDSPMCGPDLGIVADCWTP